MASLIKEQGLLDEAGNIRLDVLKAKYTLFSPEQKEKFRKYLAQMHLGSEIQISSLASSSKLDISEAAPTASIEGFKTDLHEIEPGNVLDIRFTEK